MPLRVQPIKEEPVIKLRQVPQGPGSRFDSDTVDGIQAVTADKTGPNVLVATDNNGKLPSSVVPTGGVVQVVQSSSSAYLTTATTIPLDDTIPQNTEGGELLTVAITPKATANILIITASILCSGGSGGYNATVALFQDTTADALAVAGHGDSTNRLGCVVLKHKMTANTTSSTTFKVRGGTSANFNMNGQGARLYGGKASSTLTVEEFVG